MKTSRIILLSIGALALATAPCHAAKRKSTTDKIAEARTKAWDAWRTEWQKTDTTLAPFAMQPLEDATTCAWVLPDSLEPSATMNFFSGVKGERPEKGYPFFLYLHGSGPRQQEWTTGLQLAKSFNDAPSAYLIPQIPNEGEFYRWWHKSKQWTWDRVLRRVLMNSDIDPARIYMFGISEGGYGSQRLASFYADYLAAAGPMAGGEPLRNAPAENLSHTAFSLLTGEKDAMFYRNILTPRTGDRLDSLERMYPGEYTHRVGLEVGHGHPVTYRLTTPWLKTFTRCAQPKHFRWENYEMDGWKRNAFYNLEVLQESSPERHDYEVTVEDNVVRIDVRQVTYIITERDPNWGIELDNTRTYAEAPHGRVRIYLSEQLIDPSRPVTLIVNGKTKGKRRMKLSQKNLANSCRLYGDPLRIFPYAIVAKW